MDVALPIVVQTLDKHEGVWCPMCEDITAVTLTYSIHVRDDMAIGETTGCLECGVTL